MRNAMWVGGGITGMGEIPMLGVKEKGIAKVIRDIFRNGEKGFFYDPSDMGTLFQDSGLTPLTGAMQPVGAMLDKSRGLKEGLEIFNTLDLSVGGGWTTSGAIIDRTSNQFTTSGIGGLAYRVASGRSYKLSMKGHSTVPFSIRSTTSGASGFDTIPAGDFDIVAYPIAVLLNNIYLFFQLRAAGVFTLEHISLKEIPGNHAYQTNSAARPILQQAPILGLNVLPNFDFTTRGTAGTGTKTTTNSFNIVDNAGGVRLDGVFEVGKTYKIKVKFTTTASNLTLVNAAIGAAPVIASSSSGDIDTIWTTTSNYLYLRTVAGTTTVALLEIREVSGYRTNQNYIKYDGVDDKLITGLAAPITNATVLRAVPGVGTQVKYSQTLPLLYEDDTNHAGLVAIDRALTRQEQLRLMTELDKKAGATSLDTLTIKAFDNNQEGFVYDPNDLSTLYQDAVGTVPVTAAGQPVGLILDKSKGLRIGANLTPQKSFAEGIEGWSLQSGWTFTGGKVSCNGSTSLILSNTKFVLGKRYRITIVAARTSAAGTLSIRNGASSATAIAVTEATGIEVIERTVHVSDSAQPHIFFLSQAGWAGEISSIRIEEVLGNHAYQTTSASRPILRKNAVTGANYLEFDGTDDYLQVDNVALPSPLTLIYAVDKSVGAYGVLLSTGGAGYINITTNGVGLGGQQSIARKTPKDVVSFRYVGDDLDLRTSVAEVTLKRSNIYATKATKFIGSYSPTGQVRFNGNIYGIIAVAKDMTISEENNFRSLFNSRLGE